MVKEERVGGPVTLLEPYLNSPKEMYTKVQFARHKFVSCSLVINVLYDCMFELELRVPL
jgi:hypothetical protein